MTPMSGRVTFDAFALDLDRETLCRSGRPLKLRPQPMRVLCLLVGRAGDLVEREEIRRLLWGDSTFVDYDVGIDYCIYRIRVALGDNAKRPRFLETLPGRGYRFTAAITRERTFAEPTVAVLPFANLNRDPARDYFADGITDALITELARIPSLRVISRQSVLHLKGSSLPLGAIAADLNVDGLVEGTVFHEGSRARLTAQFVLPQPERHVWAESYDCDLSAVLMTQREVAAAIARCVAAALRTGGEPTLPPAVAHRVTPEIADAFLGARAAFDSMTAEGIGRALQYFREITLKAPDFAPGLAWYAACLFMLGYWGHAPASEVFPSAKHLALQAVALDDSLARARLVLAWMKLLLDWDLDAAAEDVRRAIELSPSETDAHAFYSTLLSFVGRKDEALEEVQYMLKLNPAPLLPNQYAAWMFLHLGEYLRAETQARRTIARFPDSLQPYFVLGWSSWYQDRADEAVAALERAAGHSREALAVAYLGHLYGRLGRTSEARALLGELEALRLKGQAPPSAFAILHAGLGEPDIAFEWLETAYRLRDGTLFWLPGTPGLDPLHSDARFASLVRRVGVAWSPRAPAAS